jgi:ATP dependent DNA ligase domain
LTDKYPAIRIALELLRVRSVTMEAVYCGKDGLSDFEKLHSQTHDDDVFFYAFDLLELNGEDLRAEPLEVRKGKLERLLAHSSSGLRLVEHMEGDGPIIFRIVALPDECCPFCDRSAGGWIGACRTGGCLGGCSPPGGVVTWSGGKRCSKVSVRSLDACAQTPVWASSSSATTAIKAGAWRQPVMLRFSRGD